MAKEKTTDKLIVEAGASEGSLSPNGGTATGDVRTKTIADIVTALGSLGPDDLNGFKASLAQIGQEANLVPGDAEGKNRKSVETKPSHASIKGVVKEDLTKIFEQEGSETPLSEAFIENATTLFESAVTLRVADEIERIEEALQADHEQTIAETIESYNDRLDTYLDYVAEKYLEDNRVAVDSMIRTELSEAFITDLRSLFETHNIDLPESDVDVVSSLQEEVDQLKERLNEVTALNIELSEERENYAKAEVLAGVIADMPDSQKDKIISLAEDIDFEGEDEFKQRIVSIKESLFAAKDSGSTGLILEEDGVMNEDPKTPVQGPMGDYVAAISRTLNR